MPFFEDLQGESEPTLEDVEMTPAKIGSNKDVSTTILRQKMWAATNLSAALAGADPMKAIGDLVAQYWARDMQKELIAILAGVFGTTTADPSGTPKAETRMADHILDLSTGKTDAAKKISASAFIDACQMLGDAQAQLTGVAMHSATKSYLKKLNLIETERDSTDVEFDTYQGRRVTVDDGCPVEDGVYTTYLFGNGAVAYGNGSPVGHVATETDRDKKTGGGVDYLINRKAFILHPRGIAYTGANVGMWKLQLGQNLQWQRTGSRYMSRSSLESWLSNTRSGKPMELAKLKVLLGIEDDSKDVILEFVIADVEEIIKNYCHVEEMPDGLVNTGYRMAMDLYRNENIGSETAAVGTVSSISEGDTSTSFQQYVDNNFKDTVLKNYKSSLNRYRKVAWK